MPNFAIDKEYQMRKSYMRMFALAVLLMFGMGAWADEVQVVYGPDGVTDGREAFTGGTIVSSQKDNGDGTVEVTLTVTPYSGYTISMNDITVYATLSAGGASPTRTPEISAPLTLSGDDPSDLSQSRIYTCTVNASLGVWVEKADFIYVGNRGVGELMGYYYIRNTNNTGYYLCPAWTYNYNSDMATPFLTTYTTDKDNNSIWRIYKVTDGDAIYYRFLHNATGKYLTVNDVVTTDNKINTPTARMRLHLEASDSPGENTLFFAKQNTTGNYAFRPKSSEYYDATSDYCWFDIADGNQNSYCSGSYKGTLGFWLKEDEENIGNIAKWALDEADEALSTPIISYNAATQTYIISYPLADDGVTIHYTTDGTDPDANSATYTTSIPAADGQTLKAIATKGSLSSDIAEVTYSPLTPVMLRNGGNSTTSYYLCPPMDPESATDLYVTTSNVPTQKLVWLIEYAGTDGFYRYYHFKNQTTGQYLYCSGNNNSGNTFVMKDLGADGTEVNRFKFRFVSSADGAVLIVSGIFNMSLTNAYMFKQSGNDQTNNLGCYADNANGNGRWTIVEDDPKTASQLPSSMVTTASEAHYFKIQNVNDNDYYLNPPVPPSTVATCSASASCNNYVWYFEEAADNDPYATYYNIRNAYTGDYLYFKGNAGDKNTFFTSSDTSVDGADYKFIVVRTAGATADKDNNSYHIIPKSLRETPNQVNIAMNKTDKETTLRSFNSRNKDASRWNLVPSSFVVAPPIITYDATNNQIVLSCTTPGITAYYYTTDGSTPSTGSTLYSAAFDLADNVTTIKAIAVKDGTSSPVATYTAVVHASTDDTKRPYLIQNLNCTAFYMIPGAVSSGNTTVNTYSLGRPGMAWNLYDAGTTNGIVFCYIKNNETGDYLFCNSDGNVYLKSSENFDATSDDYKFCIISDANDGVRIVPKSRQTYWLNKDSGNNSNKALNTSNNTTATTCRWNFIPIFDNKMPAETPPFTVTTSTKGAYYKIGNAGAPTYYIIPPTGPTGNAQYVNTSATESDEMIWFFKKAASDDWLTYYYIVNAVTGQYLYFNSLTTQTGNNTAFVTRNITDSSPDTEYRFQFAVARTTQSETDGYYYIVPKPIRYLENANYALVWRDGTNPLKTNASRDNAQRKWTFTTATYKCATPTFNYTPSTRQLTISSSTPEAIIYYTTDGSEPTVTDGTVYTGAFTLGESVSTVKAVAYRNTDGSDLSAVGEFTFNEISSTSQITSMGGYYVLASGFTADSSVGTEANPFTGTIDGGFNERISLNAPLIAYAQDATVKNVVISKATISGGVNVGAIANIAKGNTRIYNCGILEGTVSGTGNVGGLVGLLDDDSRVINCYSYADITGGTTVGGIVGYNNYATTQANLRTMVMNCMMYGDITGGTDVYPVYGGEKITNKDKDKGVNNYNFYRDEAKITVADLDHYFCSWPVEEEYLTRFDYVRSALNANRELCAWWITGDVSDTALVAKWVYAPQEKPHPILKRWGRYPSMINRDIDGKYPPMINRDIERKSLYPREGANDYEGKQLGTLTVKVQDGNGKSIDDLLLPITDMDINNYDYGYYKVQLPYFNDVFGNPTATEHTVRYGGNYTKKVVVGWEVVSVVEKEGLQRNSFIDDEEKESRYNFADRNCTEKDLFSKSGRVFAQGGYYYVPEGVTGISIRAHWAWAYYCANTDYARDRIDFNGGNNTSYVFTPAGTIDNTFHGEPVYAGLVAAQNAITTTGGVYDNAIVLVGNVQHRNGTSNGLYTSGKTKGFTIMSVDLDFDDEPDYVLPLQTGQKSDKAYLNPIRFDFVQAPDLGMVLKRDMDKNRLAVSCIYMTGHFEITETSALHFNELYFGNNDKDKLLAPVIFNGGQTLEFVAGEKGNTQDRTQYIIAGGNAHMRSLYQGNHNKQTYKIKHAPMSVMGGEFDECYLSGNIRSMASTAVWQNDSPHLYTNGGRFTIIAGAGQEAVNGSVYFQIDHSIVDEFYGGSTSETGQVTGDINVQIDHSRVGKYCGGPMVGNMAAGKTITTRATGTTFGQFFGAGNGGTSYTKIEKLSEDLWSGDGLCLQATDNDWKLSANYSPMRWDSKGNKSYEARYHFEIWTLPSGTAAVCAARRYVYGAQFAATETGSVTSTLTNCIFEGDFYGGGNLGAVKGDVTSTLTDCEVKGSVYGAGYSATIPSFECYPLPPESFPRQDPNTSICHDYKVGKTESYTWTNEGSYDNDKQIIEKDGIKYVHTDSPLDNLGSVSGDVTLTLDGTTKVTGSVYGGGDESALSGNATVTLQGDTEVTGSVFGGGNEGDISGNTSVNIKE